MNQEQKTADNSTQEWDKLFNSEESEELLEQMAEQALQDFEQGNTKPLNEKETPETEE